MCARLGQLWICSGPIFDDTWSIAYLKGDASGHARRSNGRNLSRNALLVIPFGRDHILVADLPRIRSYVAFPPETSFLREIVPPLSSLAEPGEFQCLLEHATRRGPEQ